MRKEKNHFIWCDLQQKNRALMTCPTCKKFPCKGIGAADLEELRKTVEIEKVLVRLTRKKVYEMMFLIADDKTVSIHKGTLENIPAKVASTTKEVVEVANYCYEQTLQWVQKEKVDKVKKTEKGEVVPVVIETTDGKYEIGDLDPTAPAENVAKIYPIKKLWVRKFVQKKVQLGKPKARSAKSAQQVKK